MSYCRWSTDDFRSDLYVYHDCGGQWVVHVAAKRVAFAETLPPKLMKDSSEAGWSQDYVRRTLAVLEIVQRSERVPIGLSRDGKSGYFDSPGEAADLVESLAEEGYIVPDGVVEEIREEAGC